MIHKVVPSFEFRVNDQIISNQSMLGKKYMLSFYRYASCPFCNLRISFLIELHQALALDQQFIGVFQSSEEDMAKYVSKQDLSFPLVSDEKKTYYKKFGVEKSMWAYIKGALKVKRLFEAYHKGFKISHSYGDKTTVPADFLINEEGIIEVAYYGNDISDHLDLEIVTEFFRK